MADIKVSIKVSNETDLVFENEDIIKLSTRTRSTSNPDRPIFNAFSSLGTIQIEDRDLSIYNKAKENLFDEYKYNVDIFLNGKQISKHTINERPKYDYSNKTLTIQLGNNLDILDELNYSGYTYPLKSQTLDYLFIDLMDKAFGVDGNTLLDQPTYDDSSETFRDIFTAITIPYPYLSSKKYREAFSNVLTMAKCSLIIGLSGEFKLVKMNRTAEEIPTITYQIGQREKKAIIVDSSQTSSPVIPNVILDNKFDGVELETTKVETSVSDNQLLSILNPNINGYNVKENTNVDGSYSSYNQDASTMYISMAKTAIGTQSPQIYDYKFENYNLNLTKYVENNLSEILSVNEIKNENIQISFKRIIRKYHGSALGIYSNGNVQVNGESFETTPYENIEEDIYNISPNYFAENDISKGTFGGGSTSAPNGITVSINFNVPTYQNQTFSFNGSSYILNSSFYTGYNRTYYFYYGNVSLQYGSYYQSQIDGIKIVEEVKPTQIEISVNGIKKTINLESNLQLFTSSSSAKNIIEQSTYGELLQYTQNDTTLVEKEQEEILNYYSNGLHTATVQVGGAMDYYYVNGDIAKDETQIFEMGDILDLKGYDGETILTNKFGDAIKWAVIDNEVSFEGGAVYQDLVLREVPAFKSEHGWVVLSENALGVANYTFEYLYSLGDTPFYNTSPYKALYYYLNNGYEFVPSGKVRISGFFENNTTTIRFDNLELPNGETEHTFENDDDTFMVKLTTSNGLGEGGITFNINYLVVDNSFVNGTLTITKIEQYI